MARIPIGLVRLRSDPFSGRRLGPQEIYPMRGGWVFRPEPRQVRGA